MIMEGDMSLYLFLEKMCEKFLAGIWYCFTYIHEIKNIYSKRYLYKDIILTKQQKEEIDKVWIENYGKNIV